MSWILIAVVVVFVIAALVAIAGKKSGGAAVGYPYVPAKALFSALQEQLASAIGVAPATAAIAT